MKFAVYGQLQPQHHVFWRRLQSDNEFTYKVCSQASLQGLRWKNLR
jgi:hypothetical protein